MVSQCAPEAFEREGKTLRCVEWVARQDDLRAVQALLPGSAGERAAIREVLSEAGLTLTCSFGRDMRDPQRNLSSLCASTRRQAVESCAERLAQARELGASRVQLVSGAAPDNPAERGAALESLQASLETLSDFAKTEAGPSLLIEPLEVADLRRATLGYSAECADLCADLHATGRNLGICFDTAHALLNREDPFEALDRVAPWLGELHLCNCVTAPDHALYGDRHPPFGPPGRLDTPDFARLLRRAGQALPPGEPVSLFCEIRNQDGEDFAAFSRRVANLFQAILTPGAENATAPAEAGTQQTTLM